MGVEKPDGGEAVRGKRKASLTTGFQEGQLPWPVGLEIDRSSPSSPGIWACFVEKQGVGVCQEKRTARGAETIA